MVTYRLLAGGSTGDRPVSAPSGQTLQPIFSFRPHRRHWPIVRQLRYANEASFQR